jgi:hypothetical protein
MGSSSTKVDGHEVIFSLTFMVEDEKEAEILVTVQEWPFRLKFSFHPNEGNEPAVESLIKPDHMLLRFLRQTSEVVSKHPQEVGEFQNGSKIFSTIWHRRFGAVNRIHVQLVLVKPTDGK